MEARRIACARRGAQFALPSGMQFLEVLLPAGALALACGVSIAQAWRGRRRAPTKWASAGGIVLNANFEIAIVRQQNRKGRLHWTLPKGRVDVGETAEQAALREVYEETGLRTRTRRLLLLHEGPRHFTYYYELALIADDGTHDRETKEVRFVSVAKAARLIRSKRDLAVLRRMLEVRTHVTAHVASPI